MNNTQKEIAINMVCHEKYAEADILFIRIKSDLSAGFAFTKNSFCYGGSVGNEIILYKDIDAISTDKLQFGGFKLFCGENVFEVTEWAKPCKGLIGRDKKAEVLVKFLSVVKNLYGVKDEINPMVWLLRNSHPVRVPTF